MSDSRFDWVVSIALYGALVALAHSLAPPMQAMRGLYEYLRRNSQLMPPGWLFGVVWFVLYGFIAVAIVLWTDRDLAHRTGVMWNATWSMIVLNLFANIIWSMLFFGAFTPTKKPQSLVEKQRSWKVNKSMLTASAFDATVIATTAIVLEVLFIAEESERKTAVIVLWTPYMLWVCYALALTCGIAERESK